MATTLAPSLGHHQAIIIQESEYMLKLKTIKWEISPFTLRLIKNICQECKVKTVQKVQKALKTY